MKSRKLLSERYFVVRVHELGDTVNGRPPVFASLYELVEDTGADPDRIEGTWEHRDSSPPHGTEWDAVEHVLESIRDSYPDETGETP